jgi:hypothetical protein
MALVFWREEKMIYIPPIAELSIHGVFEAGVPNRERVCLRPTETINLAFFGVLLARRNPADGSLSPIVDQLFWFGEKEVSPPSWIMLLTGKGETKTITESEHPIHLFFWGKEHTIFQLENIIPVVFRFGNINAVPVLPTKEQVQALAAKSRS